MSKITDTQNVLAFERNDFSTNEQIQSFYDSTDRVCFSNYLLLKSNPVDVTFSIPVTDSSNFFSNIGQEFKKYYDNNIFLSHSRNKLASIEYQNGLIDLKNEQAYSPDIYNRFENWIADSTTGIILKVDLSNIIDAYNDDSNLSHVLPHTSGCNVKYFFNINTIDPISHRAVSNESALDYYRNSIKPYFKPQIDVFKSSLSMNRLLYDHFFTQHRDSFLLFDMSNDNDYISVYFYSMRVNSTNLIVSLFKYDILWSFYHYQQNQVTGEKRINTNTDKSVFDFVQWNYTLDNGSGSNIGNIPMVAPSTTDVNPLQFVYDLVPNKQYCVGGKISDLTYSLSSLTNFDLSSISSIEINDSKQYIQLSDSSYTSLYNLNMISTSGNQFSIPFSVDTSIGIGYDISVNRILTLGQCTIFNQNEFNSKFDSGWLVQQDIFTITSLLSNQHFDSSTNVLSIDSSSITIGTNRSSIKIDSPNGKILKINDQFLNEIVVFDRNSYGLSDPQNQNLFNIICDLPPARDGKYPYSTWYNTNQKWGNNPFSAQMWNRNTDYFTHYQSVETFGRGIEYTLSNTGMRLYAANAMKNMIDNTSVFHSDTTSSTNTNSTHSGFYNSIINKMYSIRSYSPTYTNYWLNIYDVKSNTNVDVTFFDGGHFNYGLLYPTVSRLTPDSTSLHCGQYIKISFDRGDFLNMYNTWFPSVDFAVTSNNDMIYDEVINDSTVISYDSLGNKFKSIFPSRETGQYNRTLSTSDLTTTLDSFNRSNIIGMSMMVDYSTQMVIPSSMSFVQLSNSVTGETQNFKINNNGAEYLNIYPKYFLFSCDSTRFISSITWSYSFGGGSESADAFQLFELSGAISDTSWFKAYNFEWYEDGTGYVTNSIGNLYTIDISDKSFTQLTDSAFSGGANSYVKAQRYINGYFYFFNWNTSTQKNEFHKATYDLSTDDWNIEKTQTLDTGSISTIALMQCINDNTWVVANLDNFYTFITDTEISTVKVNYKNDLPRKAYNILVLGGKIYPMIYGAPFKFMGTELYKKVNNFSKLYDDHIGTEYDYNFSDYFNIKNIDTNFSRMNLSEQLQATFDKYITYNSDNLWSRWTPFLNRSWKEGNIIKNYKSGFVYSYDTVHDTTTKVNIKSDKTGFTPDYYITQISDYISIVGSIDSTYVPYVYSVKRNRLFHMPKKSSITSPESLSRDVYIGGKTIAQFGIGGIQSASADSLIYNKMAFLSAKSKQNAYGYYGSCTFDDISNMAWSVRETEPHSFIITEPKFYNNIFSPDVCPLTFDPYLSSIHTCTDDTRWLLGFGMSWFKSKYDKINVHKLVYDISSVIRVAKLNDEISLNYKLLKIKKHNANVCCYTFNEDYNAINTNVNLTSSMDFTTLDFTLIDASTLHMSGIVNVDWSIDLAYEISDFAYRASDRFNTLLSQTGDTTILHYREEVQVSCTSQVNTIPELDYSNITVTNLNEVNDFYISLDATDSTDASATLYFDNPRSTFKIFTNNKTNQLANVCFHKTDSTTVNMYVLLPHRGAVAVVPFIYQSEYDVPVEIQKLTSPFTTISVTGGSGSKFYKNKFLEFGSVSTIDVSNNLWYETPIALIPDTSILWLYNDVDQVLSSISLITGATIHSYTGIKVRQKKNHDGTIFKIWYDQSVGSDFIRYTGLLSQNGTLSENKSIDPLTSYILSNKNSNVSDLTTNQSGSIISITNGIIDVKGIDLGERCFLSGVNWYFDASDAIWISLNIRNTKAHTFDEKIIIINKNDQRYNIVGNRFDSILDGTNQINSNHFIGNMLQKNNGILRFQNQSTYPLDSSVLICFKNQTDELKYFDPLDGLVYTLNDIVVYDGAFFYKNSEYKSAHIEFAIWDKMHASMQYHDDLPLAFFNQYDGTGFVADYIYDSTSVYLLVNMGTSIDKIKVNIKSAIIVDYNSSLVQYLDTSSLDGQLVEETLFDFSGINPYGYFILERTDKVKEILKSNRCFKIKVDTTFDVPNLIGLGTLYPEYNPFGNSIFYIASEKNINKFKDTSNQKSKYYWDYIHGSTQFSNYLSPNWHWNDNTTNPDQTLTTMASAQLTSDSSELIYYFDPPLDGNNVFFIPFALLSNYGSYNAVAQSSNFYYLNWQKLYHANVRGSVKLIYDPTIYNVVEQSISQKPDMTASDFHYDSFTMNMKAFDYARLQYIPSAKELQSQIAKYTGDRNTFDSVRQLFAATTSENHPLVLFPDETITSISGFSINDFTIANAIITENSTEVDFTFAEDIDIAQGQKFGLSMIMSNISFKDGTYSDYVGGIKYPLASTEDLTVFISGSDLSDTTTFEVYDLTLGISNGHGGWNYVPVAGHYTTFNNTHVPAWIDFSTAVKVGKLHIRFVRGNDTTWLLSNLRFFHSLSEKNSIMTPNALVNIFGKTLADQGLPNENISSESIQIRKFDDYPEISILGGSSIRDLSSDISFFAMVHDGTFSIVETNNNSWDSTSITIPANAKSIIIRGIKPENKLAVPVISMHSDSTNDDFLHSNITIKGRN